MDDLTRSANRLRGRIEPQWTEEHIDDALSLVHARLRRRRTHVATSSVIALALGIALVVMQPWSTTTNTTDLDSVVSMPTSLKGPVERELQELRFGQRAVAFPLLEETELIAESVGSDEIALRLQEGAARFQVNKQPGQSFRVYAGPIVVVVVGTEFVVRHAAHYVEVSVLEGSVEVMHFSERATIGTGETRRFLRDAAGKTQTPPPAGDRPAPHKGKVATEEPSFGDDDIRRSQPQEEDRKPESQVAGQGVVESPADLLQQADMARLREDYLLAANILRRVLAAHPETDTEVIAAFSLGRVLADKLGRPAEAARAFAQARAADPDGILAEDSLAREVEACSRAGRRDVARARASEYKRLYPDGRRLRMVMQLGDLK